MTRHLKLAAGILFFAVFFLHAGVGIYRTLTLGANLSTPGWSTTRKNGHLVVSQIPASEPALALQPGDEIIALNGLQIRAESQISEFFQNAEPGTPYTIVVQRDDRFLQFRLRSEPFPLIWFTLLRAVRVVIPAIFLITGFAVFLVRPFDRQAVLLSLMFALLGGVIPIQTVSSDSGLIVGLALIVDLASGFFAAVFFHFFLIFPERSPLLRRFPQLSAYLYVPHLLTGFLYSLIVIILSAISKDQTAAFRKSFGFVLEANGILTLGYIAGGLLSLLMNYRRATLASRRKMRVVVAGSVAGFLPPLVLFGGAFLLYTLGVDLAKISQQLMQWLVLMVLFAFLLFPLSFAYAIIRHQVIPVRLIVRRGVRYLLLSRGFIIVEAVVVFAVLSFLLTGDRIEVIDQWGRRADILATAAATVAAVMLLRTVNRRVMPIIDRRFFREAYDAQQILSDLAETVRSAPTVDRMLEMVVGRIQHALHTENIAIFLREQETGDLMLAASSVRRDVATDFSVEFQRHSLVAELLRKTPEPLDVLRQESGGLALLDYDLPSVERDVLESLHTALLLPVITKDRVLGIICLGPRLGDLPFSREDRRMLMAVAWQLGMALENAELIHRAAEEQRLRREVDIAADVQRRLFPEQPPEIAGLDLSGVCIPARGVGGDYYDFLVVGGRQLGIAVADVAGKGISAALLMSIVQASLRSQVAGIGEILSNGRLTDLVASMNVLLHRSTGPHSFASFFYAQLDLQTRVMTYVNAGHNPPLLVRAAALGSTATDNLMWQHTLQVGVAAGATEIIHTEAGPAPQQDNRFSLLTRGGTVIGAFSNACYEQESLQLERGDVLIAYTDGLTEARNAHGEEFGEARLIRAVSNLGDLSAGDLSDSVVREVQEWCGETPRHDDLTLVIMKVR